MKEVEIQLLIKDLCARLPYGVKCLVNFDDGTNDIMTLQTGLPNGFGNWDFYNENCSGCSNNFKPYLRPMKTMTEEERVEFSKLLDVRYCEEDWEGHISTSYCIEIDNVYTDNANGIQAPTPFSMDAIDWLNSHHFDYRGLIKKGLALEAPEGMYK